MYPLLQIFQFLKTLLRKKGKYKMKNKKKYGLNMKIWLERERSNGIKKTWFHGGYVAE